MDFLPPFCPNPHCQTHELGTTSRHPWFKRVGFRPTKVVGPVPRFQCRVCGKGFSSRTFDVDYWTHRPIDYTLLQRLLVGGSGLRQSCRTLGVSWSLLSNRYSRMSRQSLAFHADVLDQFQLDEDLVFDGFESFAYSQDFPNNLHLLAGADSQFVLGWNAAVLRRKGRMTEAQKRRRAKIEARWKAPPGAIFKSCRELLSWGCHVSFGSLRLPLRIRSDQKSEYGRALASLRPYGEWREEGLLVHKTVSSRAARTIQNPLFAVNYLDRQLRKDLAEHGRETVRFARRLEFSLERAVIHLVHHNYFKEFRSRPGGRELTHAEVAGVERSEVERLKEGIFRERALGWRHGLESWAVDQWRRSVRVPIHRVTPLARHLLTA